ncbi:MAG: hydrolase 1, exosortase A system-associated [Proteobacteria bacterium]|nr:hydrolase 1, exosortase A system-associated [Pseudomonadota bacterium]
MSTDPRPFLLQGSRGALFAVYFPPAGTPHPAGDVLVVPPFAEEMNRCRAMLSLQARALAAIGIGTLIVDPYGTGDSAGEFEDGSWAIWRDDLTRALAWLRRHGQGCSSLLAVRLGALMAAELAEADGRIEHLLYWQPVLNGKQFHTQFLRIRIAAEMEQPDRIKTTNELRALSARGEAVEVSGYRIGPALSGELDRLALDDAARLGAARVDWFEVLAAADSVVPPASAKAHEAFRAAGADVHLATVVGPPFWHVHERELAPELIAATTACVQAWRCRDGAARSTTDVAEVPAASAAELPITFGCAGDLLCGILHRGRADARRGVVIVVAGGPQYRAGAHRQFVGLARRLAAQGHPVLRFDLRGMGDSSGRYVGFQQSEPDLRAAIDALLAQTPRLDEVVLLGECESASGILFYAWKDARVRGTVLVNPWVRTEEGQAQVIIKHYYLDRLRSRDFWRQVRAGRYDVKASLSSLVDVVRAYVRGRRMMAKASAGPAEQDISGLPLPVKTAAGLSRFKGKVLLMMSGRDYIAREFDEVTAASRAWDGLLADPRIVRRDIEGADHTFSKAAWKNAAAGAVVEWIGAW